MAIVSGIKIDAEQVQQLRWVVERNNKYPDTWGEKLNLVEESDGRFTIDDGDSILFEFVPENDPMFQDE